MGNSTFQKSVFALKLIFIQGILILTTNFAQTPLGKWEGTCDCGYGKIPLQVLIDKDSKGNFYGIINSPSQGFCSELDKIVYDNGILTIGADVPNNEYAQISGNVVGTKWNSTLIQGSYQYQVQLDKKEEIKISKLNIPSSYQSEKMWCWLTVGEMIFRYFGILTSTDQPGFQSQCKILKLIMEGSQNYPCVIDCKLCALVGGGSSREVAGMLSDFPRRLKVLGSDVPRIFSSVTPVLNSDDIMHEIISGYPVLIGITPNSPFNIGSSMNQFFPPMHVALIVGYIKSTKGFFYLINDPFPFHKFAQLNQNPYVQAGGLPLIQSSQGITGSVAYWINANDLTKLKWSESILVRVEK